MVITHSARTPTQLELFRDAGTESAWPERIDEDELLERIAECEREDRTLLRMVLAAVVATALLGVAGGLSM